MSLSLFFFFSIISPPMCFFFFFNDTATTEIYTLSLHDALPISQIPITATSANLSGENECTTAVAVRDQLQDRSEEHTSELQSRLHLVCRLLLEKKKQQNISRL